MDSRDKSGVRIDDIQDPDLTAIVELVMHKIHSPDIIASDRICSPFAKLRLHLSALAFGVASNQWRLTPHCSVIVGLPHDSIGKPVCIHFPAFPPAQYVDTLVTIAHARLCDFSEPLRSQFQELD